MNKQEYSDYLASAYWRERREIAIRRAHHKCENCGLPRWVASLIYGQDLHVHHLSYANLGKEKDEDLEPLCVYCHEIKTFSRSDRTPPRTAECVICGGSHWNVYSDHCYKCSALLGEDESILFKFSYENGDGTPLWHKLVEDLVFFFGRDVGNPKEMLGVVTRACAKHRIPFSLSGSTSKARAKQKKQSVGGGER